MPKKQMRMKKLFAVFAVMFAVTVIFFMYDYYSVSNLDSLGEELISFELSQDGKTVSLVSDYDVPFITSIRYTTDGSLPTKDSAKYTDKIVIDNDGRQGTVIRAAVFRGKKSTKVYTKTFFTQRSSLNAGIYTVCISTDPDNLYSDEKGILVLGAETQDLANADESIPMSQTLGIRANYFGKGIEWERPATVEIYSSQGEEVLTKDIGVRVTGANTREQPVKSLRLYARKEYDGKGVFELNIFDQYTQMLTNQVTTYNHLDLRSGGNNFYYTMLPDTIMRQLAYDSGFDTVGTAVPAAVYLNGEYYGLMWLQSDYCGRNIAEMAGLDKDSYIYTVKGFEAGAYGDTIESYQDYIAMYDFAYLEDFNDSRNREKLEQILDIDNCLMYYALEIYASNNDWPHNNYGLWRCVDRAGSSADNKYADGRWRFMLYDLDNAFSTFVDQVDGFDFVIGRNESPMFTNLMKSDVYRTRFINIFCDLLSTSLSAENAYDTYINLKQLIEPEMVWRNENYTSVDFDEEYRQILLYKLEYYIENRPNTAHSKMSEYFGLNQKYNLTVSNVPENVCVTLNTLEIKPGESFTGVYYKDAPATVSYCAGDGYTLDYWTVNGVKYYDEQLILDSKIAGSGDCTIEICVKKTISDAKIHSLVWGGVARYIDIYNPGTQPISLGQYSVSADNKGNYALPDIILSAGESFRIYFSDDQSAPIGAYICGIKLKEGKTIYLKKDEYETDHVYVPQFIEGQMLKKSIYDGSWKYADIKEDEL